MSSEQLAIVHRAVTLIERWLLEQPGFPQLAFNEQLQTIPIELLENEEARRWLGRSPDAERLLAFIAEQEPRCTTIHMLVALEVVGMVLPKDGNR